MKRCAILALHIAVAACSVVCFLVVDHMTWKHGAAQWARWDARWQAMRSAREGGLPDEAAIEERLAPLSTEARYWGVRRNMAWLSSTGIFALSMVLAIVFRSKEAVASFLVCLVFMFLSFERWGILF